MNRALRAATVGVLLFSPVALAACSAGQVTQTATQDRDKTGAMAEAGNITLREVRLAYPDDGVYEPGANATLVTVIANDDSTDDRLLGISGPFRGVTFTAAGATTSAAETTASAPATGTSAATNTPPASVTPEGTATAAPGARTTGAAAGTATGATTTAAQTTAASTPAQQVTTSVSVPLPAGTNLLIGLEGGPQVTVVGLKDQVNVAQTVPVTFRFEKAGEITVDAIVGNPTTVLPQGTPFDFQGSTGEDNQVGAQPGGPEGGN